MDLTKLWSTQACQHLSHPKNTNKTSPNCICIGWTSKSSSEHVISTLRNKYTPSTSDVH